MTNEMTQEEQKRQYEEARKRGWDAQRDIQEAERQDVLSAGPEVRVGSRTVSSTKFLEAIADIELENTIKLNPNTTPEHKQWALGVLERIRESEAKSRKKKKKN